MTELQAPRSFGFAPISRRDARVLILGSLPSTRSIECNEYYAHPRNAFWPIMRALTGAEGSYEQRCRALLDAGVAVWDVLANSVRPGSLDADIDLTTARVNDFQSFFDAHPGISRVCFNGQAAAKIYRKRVELDGSPGDMQTLPSTSPAHAIMKIEQKLELWRAGVGLIKSRGEFSKANEPTTTRIASPPYCQRGVQHCVVTTRIARRALNVS